MRKREIAVIIPHLGLYGGNLRYIELGNALAARGVDFTIATPEATRPDYLEYRGRVATFDELRGDPPEVLLASEQSIFQEFLEFPAGRRFFYWIIPRTERDKRIAAAGRRGEFGVLANSTGMVEWLQRKFGAPSVPVVGGINLDLFHPPREGESAPERSERFRVLMNGRFSRRRKGSRIAARAVGALARRRAVEIAFFDRSTTGHTAGLPDGFRFRAPVHLELDVPRGELWRRYCAADVFVSAEKNAGWSNQTIEAMACGLPVVCTASGTRDFAIHEETALIVRRNSWSIRWALKRLMDDEELRHRLAAAGLAKAREFPWERTADQLLAAVGIAPPVPEPSAASA